MRLRVHLAPYSCQPPNLECDGDDQLAKLHYSEIECANSRHEECFQATSGIEILLMSYDTLFNCSVDPSRTD